MNKKLKYFNSFFFFFIVIVSLFSCKNSPVIEPIKPQHTVNFYVWDNKENKYIEIPQTVEEGTLFSSIPKPETPILNIDNRTYTFIGWVNNKEALNGILTYGDVVDNNIRITGNKRYYAKYTSSLCFNVTLRIYDKDLSKYVVKDIIKVEHGEILSNIVNKYTSIEEVIIEGVRYTFIGWVSNSEDLNNILTEGEIVEDNIRVTENKTYSAKYSNKKINHTIIFNVWDDIQNKYVEIPQTVEYGTVFSSIEKPPVPTFYDFVKRRMYTFLGWIEKDEIQSTILMNGVVIDNNTKITKNRILYAKYSNDYFFYVFLKVYDKAFSKYVVKETLYFNESLTLYGINKYNKIVDDLEIDGISYSFYGWAYASSSNEILEDFNTNKLEDHNFISSDTTLCAIYQGDYLTFTAVDEIEISFDIVESLKDPIFLQYVKCTNGTKFVNYTWKYNNQTTVKGYSTSEGLKIKLKPGEKVYFKGNNTTSFLGVRFISTPLLGKIKASGNMMSLFTNEYSDKVPDYGFSKLFSDCKGLLTAPNLPATKLAYKCYLQMFSGCTLLTKAPELPATTLPTSCYEDMFYGCSSLTEAPELPATTLAYYCYASMFSGCTSLTKAPELPATTLAKNCYENMFYGCSSLTEAPELPATTITADCYKYMFYGCSSLTEAPELPATTLYNSCYSYMFNECTSLTEAPELSATTLAEDCYASMFYGCSSLTKAPELPATTLVKNCYRYMFYGCSSLTEAPELPATTLAKDCYYGMFRGCTSLTEAPELPATTLADYCYCGIFKDCTSLTEAPKLSATTLAEGCYASMFSGCTSLRQAPELPATTLAYYCYASMFSGCTSLTEAPELPATTLYDSCCKSMFSGCTSLTKAPELPATTLAKGCYYHMFYGCTSLTSITCLATDISAFDCLSSWVWGVASSGTFKCKEGVNWKKGNSGIPEWWRVEYV